MREHTDNNSNFRDSVAARPGGERLCNCFSCGTCTAGCPVSRQDESFSPRGILKMTLLGLKEEVLSSPALWQCRQCHVCVAHCPQDVRCADVIRTLRQMAVEEGYATAELAAAVEKLDEELIRRRIEAVTKLLEERP